MQLIDRCRSCDSREIERFLDLGKQPFANALLKRPQDEETQYPLSLSFCHECQLVQLSETADPKELFSNYFWVTGTSSTARNYAEVFCQRILDHQQSSTSHGYVLEVASNDGTFLMPFQQKGHAVVGIDPAANIAQTANAAGIQTVCDFFGKRVAENVLHQYGRPHVAFARNVLPHVANLHDFLDGFETCLDASGLLVLEVHYAGIILEELHYDSIYHEHLCYFSLGSLDTLLRRHHFFIEKILESPISGGSVVVFARKTPQSEDPSVQRYRDREARNGLNDFVRWKAFAVQVADHKRRLSAMVNQLCAEGKTIVGYGASARSSTLLNYCDIGSRHLISVADHNSLKSNLYTPGTHIVIRDPHVAFASAPDVVMVLAWNFLQEIVEELRETFHFTGEVIVPLPSTPRKCPVTEVLHG